MQWVTLRGGAMENELFAVLGRLHVLMRREHNRIIDVEYASESQEYARELIRLARATAHPELATLADRMESLVSPGLAATARPIPVQRAVPNDASDATTAGRYVGVLR